MKKKQRKSIKKKNKTNKQEQNKQKQELHAIVPVYIIGKMLSDNCPE